MDLSNSPPTYVIASVISAKPAGGRNVELEFVRAQPCTSQEVCALNTQALFSIRVDGKEILTIPGSVLKKSELEAVYSALGVKP